MATMISSIMTDDPAREFEFFYEEYFNRVYNYARHRTGSRTRADEITSETFLRAMTSWSKFDLAKGDRGSWLFSIAFCAVADNYRSQKRRKWLTLGLAPEPAEPPPFKQDERQARLFEVLAKLDDRELEIVSLKFYGGMTNRVIAQVLGLGESNVAVILFRAVRRMREDFEAMENDHD